MIWVHATFFSIIQFGREVVNAAGLLSTACGLRCTKTAVQGCVPIRANQNSKWKGGRYNALTVVESIAPKTFLRKEVRHAGVLLDPPTASSAAKDKVVSVTLGMYLACTLQLGKVWGDFPGVRDFNHIPKFAQATEPSVRSSHSESKNGPGGAVVGGETPTFRTPWKDMNGWRNPQKKMELWFVDDFSCFWSLGWFL